MSKVCSAGLSASRALAAQIQASQAAGDADLGDTYDHHWPTALERLVAE